MQTSGRRRTGRRPTAARSSVGGAAALLSDEITQLAALGWVTSGRCPGACHAGRRLGRAGFSARGIDPDPLLGDGVDILDDVARTPEMRTRCVCAAGTGIGTGSPPAATRRFTGRCSGGRPASTPSSSSTTMSARRLRAARRPAAGPLRVSRLMSTKRPALEAPDLLLSRIEEASRFYPRDQLGLSPQCGFSSAIGRYPLDAVQQRRKLRLVSDVARLAWPV